MNETHLEKLTFALLDREQGVPEPPAVSKEDHSLPAWYKSIREVPLDELSIGDIGRAIRQNIHLGHVVPLALHRLLSEPLAGDMYDGELLASLKSVPREYWANHETDRLSLKSAMEMLLRQEAVPS